MSDYTLDELLCVCISRQVTDGDVLAQGISTPLVQAGYILARLTHAPNVHFASAIGQCLAHDWRPLSVARAEDGWMQVGEMFFGFAGGVLDVLPSYNPKEFFRPAQVDRHGNFNNIAIGSDYRRPRLRLPGTGGIPDVTTYSEHVYLYVPRHSRVTFVEQVDFVSGLGHTPNRQRGSGPRYLVSDLGEFDWAEAADGTGGAIMRLVRLFPGVTVEQVARKTAFALAVAPDLGETPPPSADELRLLREVIDPLGVRRLELLGGAARKETLRVILAAEGAL